MNPLKTKLLHSKLFILFLLGIVALLSMLFVFFFWNASLQKKNYEIIVIGKTNQANISFWETFKLGLEQAAQEFDVHYTFWGPNSESNLEGQISLIQKAILEKPDAIILSAVDYEKLLPWALAIQEANIRLLTVDSDVKSSRGLVVTSFIATDNIQAGEKAGQAMADLLKTRQTVSQKPRIGIIAHQLGSNSALDREKGVKNILSEKFIILPTLDAEGSQKIAYTKVIDLIAQYPDIQGIVGLNEYSTLGASQALVHLDRKDIFLVGFDSSTEQIVALESEVLNASVIQRPFNMGYISIKLAVLSLKGETIPSFYDTGSILVTKENMYSEENEKLLFPFAH